jgi:hypothetical protein
MRIMCNPPASSNAPITKPSPSHTNVIARVAVPWITTARAFPSSVDHGRIAPSRSKLATASSDAGRAESAGGGGDDDDSAAQAAITKHSPERISDFQRSTTAKKSGVLRRVFRNNESLHGAGAFPEI